MKVKEKLLNRTFLIILIGIFFLSFFAFLIIDGYLNLERDGEIYLANAKDMISQRVDSLLYEGDIFPQGIGDDILFLGRLSSLKKIADSNGESSSTDIETLKEDFLNYMLGDGIYYQLRYINENGMEVVKVESNGNSYYAVPQSELEDESGAYYFSEAMEVGEGKLYLSDFDLEFCDNSNNYIPTIRVATPIANSFGTKKGIIIFNLDTDYFLEDIRRAQREGEAIFLVNSNGYYLAHPDSNKEFGFIFDEDSNLYNDYPELPEEILLDTSQRNYETDNYVFSLKQIYPLAQEKKFYNLKENSFWILVTVSDKLEIEKVISDLRKEYIYFLVFSGMFILLIILLIFLLSSKYMEGNKK